MSDDWVMLDPRVDEHVDPYLAEALRGERQLAVRRALAMFHHGISSPEVISVLTEAQRRVGDRWYRNEITVADEHVATGVSGAALGALMVEDDRPALTGHTVVACAEGDWHALAAELFGAGLRAHGVRATILGASTPAEAVADFLSRHDADSLAVSCSLATHFPGVARLADTAHDLDVPVIAGGRAFAASPGRARRLGADGWATDPADAVELLARWRRSPPRLCRPAALAPAPLALMAAARELGDAALPGFVERVAPVVAYDERQRERAGDEMALTIGHLGAAWLVADDTVFEEFVDWLGPYLVNLDVPVGAVHAGLDAIRAVVAPYGDEVSRLLDVGARRLRSLL